MHVSDHDPWFTFNLPRELFNSKHTSIKRVHVCCLVKEIAYLERRSLFHGGEFPIHSDSLLKVNCPLCPLHFPHLSHTLPAYRAFITLYKDDLY
jgi:hypothetical protein